MLRVENLSYQYDDNHFDFSFNAPVGSITAILGASGSGKSTLLSLICGILPTQKGKIFFQEQDFTKQNTHERPLSILFQEHNVFNHLTAQDNIALGINPNLSINAKGKAQIHDAARLVQIDPLLTRYPDELSGGQKQRVALARCLARKRPLLLLDEPFSALDTALRQEMLTIVKSLAKKENITVLMVTHQIEDAKAIADQMLWIKNGQVAFTQSIEDLKLEFMSSACSASFK